MLLEYKTAHSCGTETTHTGGDNMLAASSVTQAHSILESRQAKHATTT